MRVKLSTPLENLTKEQKEKWIPKQIGKTFRGYRVTWKYARQENFCWRPAPAGVVVYIPYRTFIERLAVNLPDPSLVPWALQYLHACKGWSSLERMVSGEQPLSAVTCAAEELAAQTEMDCLQMEYQVRRLEELRRAGLIAFTMPVF